MNNNICPKCKNKFLEKQFFGEKDGEGVVGRVVHSYKLVNTVVGHQQVTNSVCYLTEEQWNELKGV